MKKFISIILALAMVSALSVTAFAATEPQTNNTQDMTVTATSYSTYVYSIPESLDVTSKKYLFKSG